MSDPDHATGKRPGDTRLIRRRTLLSTAAAGGAALGALIPPASAAEREDLGRIARFSSQLVPSYARHPRGDASEPDDSRDRKRGVLGIWPGSDMAWIQYEWDKPVAIDQVALYWCSNEGIGFTPHIRIGAPKSYALSYWDGGKFVPVKGANGYGTALSRYNSTTFEKVTTTRLRLQTGTETGKSVGILRWQVPSAGPAPALAPHVAAGMDRILVVGGNSFLAGDAAAAKISAPVVTQWSSLSGPGPVTFGDPARATTTARVAVPGDYLLQFSASVDGQTAHSTLKLRAEAPPPAKRLEVVYTRPYAVTSAFWKSRARSLIVNWIPHCIDYCERTDLPDGQGGLDNFREAAKALRGEPHGPHKGFVFSNAWVHQTVESMCIALMVDAQGDAGIEAAQDRMRATLERWIPVVLSAQEQDGYLQTAYTLADRKDWPARWSPQQRANHEGYTAGYFIESAINHHTLTRGRDLRLYNAAKKLADCWAANIGPGRKEWFDGHQEMEQALVRFGRFVNDVEGQGRGDRYIKLARFLLESRKGGAEYDQSHVPPEQQYEAVGHAVRAVYFYSGMADISAETGDRDYLSAVRSLSDNIVNRKYYITGGVGSGDTDEGFGADFALSNDAYCESCASCGLMFFQYKLNLAYHDARYFDLFEETMYNALLGAVDLEGHNFCYTNPLINSERTAWHHCPCCVGNISRTLLMMPTWTYARDDAGVYVNLFNGSRIDVGTVAGTELEMVQETNYPWTEPVAITVNPAKPVQFTVHVRVPNRRTSALYRSSPEVQGLRTLRVNGQTIQAPVVNGYAVISRNWKKGDRIDFEVPLDIQRVVSDPRVAAATGKVALRRGPLVYSVEAADQPRIDGTISALDLRAEWKPELLGGVTIIKGQWSDGAELIAIPNYARMNRTNLPPGEFPVGKFSGSVRSRVWIGTTI